MPMHAIRVECRGPLPPADSIAAAVWGHRGRVDGPVNEDWTRLRLASSSEPGECVEIDTLSMHPRIVEVVSADPDLAHTAALHLAMETHGRFL
jgi:hypothetical protein